MRRSPCRVCSPRRDIGTSRALPYLTLFHRLVSTFCLRGHVVVCHMITSSGGLAASFGRWRRRRRRKALAKPAVTRWLGEEGRQPLVRVPSCLVSAADCH